MPPRADREETPTGALHVTRGLPGSGKSTYARQWVAADPAGRVRVNRDCLRDMAHGGCYRRPDTEAAVDAAQHSVVRALLVAGWDVICDDTNLRRPVMAAWEALAGEVGAVLVVVDMTGVPVGECVRRDGGRPDRGFPPVRWDGARVGAGVIEEMASWYFAGGAGPES